jgi:hypothetical protein
VLSGVTFFTIIYHCAYIQHPAKPSASAAYERSTQCAYQRSTMLAGVVCLYKYQLGLTKGYVMRIEYELKFRDPLFFNIMHQFLSIPTQLFYGGLTVFIGYSSFGEQSLSVSIIGAILFYLTIWLALFLFTAFYLCFGKNRSLYTKHVVEIQDDAFYEETQFAKLYYFWSGLAKVIVRPGFIGVFINANAAHILPSRAFSSPEHRQEFLASLMSKLNAA